MTAFCDTETTRLTMLVFILTKIPRTLYGTREGVTQSNVRPNPPRYAWHHTMGQGTLRPGRLDRFQKLRVDLAELAPSSYKSPTFGRNNVLCLLTRIGANLRMNSSVFEKQEV